jgi:hypothetical protein
MIIEQDESLSATLNAVSGVNQGVLHAESTSWSSSMTSSFAPTTVIPSVSWAEGYRLIGM